MKNYNTCIMINEKKISLTEPTYFIADIASNHNGDIELAKELIFLAKEAGADAVKFQHFLADKIVSDFGFRSLTSNLGHQAKWNKSVYDVYKEYECNRQWTNVLVETAQQACIDFMSTPYDLEAIHLLDPYISAYKIGSGDITWIEFISEIAKHKKPVFLATGASCLADVERAVGTIIEMNPNIVLMQCNTNYTGSLENFKYVNLNVLKLYAQVYPEMVLGLSDHTYGHVSVLGAIALGARVIEKHFTKDNHLVGPDHSFSMVPESWREMVLRARELEASLGDGIKKVEKNEYDTVIVQRRCIRINKNISRGEIIKREHLDFLRPAPKNAFLPYQISLVEGKKLLQDKIKGEALYFDDVGEV